jgi:hypothetical protein
MSHIPTPIRAALGLAATAVAEARRLPETLPQLPVAAVSTAMQASLRVQQRIATYAARGDEVISQLRGTSAEPPSWATFDDAPADAAADAAKAAFDRAEPVNLEDTAADLADAAPGGMDVGEPGGAEPAHLIDTALATSGAPAADIEGPGNSRPPAAKAGKAAPGKTPPAKVAKAVAKEPAKKATAKKAAASVPAKKAAGKKAPAKKAAKKSEPLAEAARKADPAAGPNPSTMAAEILHAHQGESPTEQGASPGQQ